ncbi:MAG: hypothetical protein COW76_01315 [Shewanella sp. CG18_big_fil_WC_8_21_14_2_50_42_11]|nr:MAG: hypothetical protein COW76_01315 [Shewanella sp. CG18_big_fil_WC_8_21_14_2_50_42_11]PIX73073.1 MAG: hypothetical protein COZ42_03265 [Shewanella sp. CG_4_10_14_3_um_filter_42_91]PIY63765.1 MAG: hypothetical protein COY92_19745 [Shewanella sp. CG_4_10_14_0_8_um_filter_42_13]PJB92560.1 MAG: hypothetical protein CO084_05885 [Shewanella sp. CG_4_9_14_0_8_um_filter_42_14]
MILKLEYGKAEVNTKRDSVRIFGLFINLAINNSADKYWPLLRYKQVYAHHNAYIRDDKYTKVA